VLIAKPGGGCRYPFAFPSPLLPRALSVSFGETKKAGRSICLQEPGEIPKAHEIKLVRVFKEEGVSGAKELAGSPAFVARMEAPHPHGVKVVLFTA
jgi:hypothetical protein